MDTTANDVPPPISPFIDGKVDSVLPLPKGATTSPALPDLPAKGSLIQRIKWLPIRNHLPIKGTEAETTTEAGSLGHLFRKRTSDDPVSGASALQVKNLSSSFDLPRTPSQGQKTQIADQSLSPAASRPNAEYSLQNQPHDSDNWPDKYKRRSSDHPDGHTPTGNYKQSHPQAQGQTLIHSSDPYKPRSSSKLRSDSPRINSPDDRPLQTRKISSDNESILSSGRTEITGVTTKGNHVAKHSRSMEIAPPLQYHHRRTSSERNNVPGQNRGSKISHRLHASQPSLSGMARDDSYRQGSPLLVGNRNDLLDPVLPRPSSVYSSTSEPGSGGRHRSPQLSPSRYTRSPSSQGRKSPGYDRPLSFIDLLNVPYPQPAPAPANLDHAHLQHAVGTNASLLSTQKTLEMYRANVKKTNEPDIQYSFALFMINAVYEATMSKKDEQPVSSRNLDGSASELTMIGEKSEELLEEARQILQRLSDRSYPFAQYYLADGYASGLLNKGKEDNDRAFPLFVAASKHGHAEAGYRTGLCYEFGWGTRQDVQKSVQFYRQSASKNHPGAMLRLGRACLTNEMGITNRYREGLKWLKRAAESADLQYNAAPYELGRLHEAGHGEDVFKDESYAAQLFTQSADLGHVEANYRLGDAYEHGKLTCPYDPALSIHFYSAAAENGHPLAMMALCAWYMVGTEPVLSKDENEAYEWAKKAAECGAYISLPGPFTVFINPAPGN